MPRPPSLSRSRSRSGSRSKSRSKSKLRPGDLLLRIASILAWATPFIFLLPAHLFGSTMGRGLLVEAGMALLLLAASFICRYFAKRRSQQPPALPTVEPTVEAPDPEAATQVLETSTEHPLESSSHTRL